MMTPYCHPRESGDPVTFVTALDSRVRGNDGYVVSRFGTQ